MNIVILYASETGNAEDLSFNLKGQLCNQGFDCRTMNIDDYDISQLFYDKFVIFVVSTTGDGEVPWSMKTFWNLLKSSKLEVGKVLPHMNFAVFGLGDSSYDQFNLAARNLHKRLSDLGGKGMGFSFLDSNGKEVHGLGLGDDQGKYGYFTAYDAWYKVLLPVLLNHRGLRPETVFTKTSSVTESSDESPEGEYSFSTVKTLTGTAGSFKAIIGCITKGSVLLTKVHQNKRLTAVDWNQDVRHIELVVDDSKPVNGLRYQPGDVAEVFYRNSSELVKRAVDRLLPSLTSQHPTIHSVDTVITVERNIDLFGERRSRVTDLPPITILQLFTSVLNIGAVPKRSFFSIMSQHASDSAERDKLLELSSGEGTDLYFDYCVREKRSYIEVLEEFPSVSPTLYALLSAIPVIQPRQYSIASSAAVDNSKVALCIAVVKYKTRYGRPKSGLCTNFLASLNVNDEVCIKIRPGGLRDTRLKTLVSRVKGSSTDNHATSGRLILVGPGTGVAPMRSIIQQYCSSSGTSEAQSTSDAQLPEILLLFGCRKHQSDYLYGSEWDELNSSDANGVRVITAFSQDQAAKDYVTHAIDRNSAMISQMIQQGCGIFVAGSAKRMPSDVKKAFIAALNKEQQDSQSGGTIIDSLIQSKKYVVEAWE